MEPEFHNGDKVLVQRFPNFPQLEPGDIGAFITGNETYIKEYQ
ncbi:MAG: S24 family peptidase, partial [Oscillospiraceae bacterium]|nr:S24 family peptidase [Oscillospiraceae bacterium]